MDLEFGGEIWFSRGPSPSHFVTVPDEPRREIEDESSSLTYGWA